MKVETRTQQDRRVLNAAVTESQAYARLRAEQRQAADAILGDIEHVIMWTEQGRARHSTIRETTS